MKKECPVCAELRRQLEAVQKLLLESQAQALAAVAKTTAPTPQDPESLPNRLKPMPESVFNALTRIGQGIGTPGYEQSLAYLEQHWAAGASEATLISIIENESQVDGLLQESEPETFEV